MAIIKKFRIKSFKNKNPIIELENISLAYGNRLILDNINFKINESEIFGMLGPNGVGKSTIFNLITGLITPKNGKIKTTPNQSYKTDILMPIDMWEHSFMDYIPAKDAKKKYMDGMMRIINWDIINQRLES